MAEAAGALPQVLSRLSDYEEKAYRTEMMFRQAMVYPCWIMFICLVFVVWVPPFLFGELFTLLENSGVELPLLTKVILALSKMAGSPFFYLFSIVAVFFGARAFMSLSSSPRSRYRLYSLLHKNKFVGQQLTALATCRFARCLEMLSDVGVPITQSLKLAGNAAGNPVLKHNMPSAIEAMINGATLEDAMSEADFFSRPFLSTVRLGQEAGSLSQVLSKIVVLYETELEYRARAIISALEPLAMLFMGLTVGVFIIATMSPLMQLIQTL